MIRNEHADPEEFGSGRPRMVAAHSRDHSRPARTIVIRQGGTWLSVALLCLALVVLGIVLVAQRALQGLDVQDRRATEGMAAVERRLQQLEAGVGFDSNRRRLLLTMRDQILKANPRVSLHEAYRFAELALNASEKYPAVDPLLLLAIGIVESGYDPLARSPADARGLYQIWPSTGRLLARSLGWEYDETTLYDPEKNTQAAALYLDILFAAYRDPQMVLAEYNGGPLNAGYFRARVGALSAETRNYVPRVLELHSRLREEFDGGSGQSPALRHGDVQRDGKLLGSRAATVVEPTAAGRGVPGSR